MPELAFSAVHIYFPDPWPKDKHARHRLIQPDFLPRIRRILAPDGVLYLRTDAPPYFEQMQKLSVTPKGSRRNPRPLPCRKSPLNSSANG